MSTDNEFELELIDDSNEPDSSSEEMEIEEEDDDTSSRKPKNESNFKKLYKSHKEDQKRIKELEETVNLLKNAKDSEPEYVAPDEDKIEKLEKKAFLLENKDAAAHIDKVVEAKNRYGMEYEDAWALVQAKLPKESRSSDDFDFKSEPVKVKKTLKDISPEEALKLPKDQLARWQVFHGYASE